MTHTFLFHKLFSKIWAVRNGTIQHKVWMISPKDSRIVRFDGPFCLITPRAEPGNTFGL